MSYPFQTAFFIFGIRCGSICLAENSRCDWNVVGIAGGDMTGVYRCGSTVGQTAAGLITGPGLRQHALRSDQALMGR
jgi:hypothetical protein